jgi:peptide chain release factor
MWVHITAGQGPGECQIAVKNLANILCVEAKQHNIQATYLDDQEGEHGLLSVLIALEGDDLEAFIASWEGSIKWICQSPIRNAWKRKNWFVSVSVIRPPAAAMAFKDTDLKFDSYRASGPGGQHVQKTDSAVRVTHIPTGTVAQAQEERSQYRNKALAVARLAAMFVKQGEDAQAAVDTEIWSKHYGFERGNPVRVYMGLKFIQR